MRLAQEWCTTHHHARLTLLDVGTGASNLAISLAHTLPQAHVWAVDCAYEALQVARQNAQHLGVAERLHWVCSDLLTAFQGGKRCFALCVANLPYLQRLSGIVCLRKLRTMNPMKLCGGQDGLELIRRMAASSPEVLTPGGILLLEVVPCEHGSAEMI